VSFKEGQPRAGLLHCPGGAMAKGPFTAEQFVATQFNTAEDKAKFGNHFLHFVKSDFERRLFTKPFYNRLSLCFSHIAHYDIFGFYDTWFERDVDRLGFLKHTLGHPCHGDPAFTFSDVERAIQIELSRLSLIPIYEQRIGTAVRTCELAELERLKKKYETSSASESVQNAGDQNAADENPVPEERAQHMNLGANAVQGLLFQ
jgi:hypothetical protein